MTDCLLILGMHRSGTSAVAGACAQLGVDFGRHLIGAQDDNVKGYFEDERVLDLHESYLSAVGSSWDDLAPAPHEDSHPRRTLQQGIEELLAGVAKSPFPGFKDPRMSRLVIPWLDALRAAEREPVVLLVHRPVGEVIRSLARRNGFGAEKSALLWADHLLRAERSTRGVRRAFVSYPALLEDPATLLGSVAAELGVEWPTAPDRVADSLREFVDPALRHTTGDAGATAGCGRATEPCRAIATALTSDATEAAFDAASRELDAAVASIDPLLTSHLLQVTRRERTEEIWAAVKPVEKSLAREASRTEERREEIAAQVEILTAELDRLATLYADSSESVQEALQHLSQVSGQQGEVLDRLRRSLPGRLLRLGRKSGSD